MTLHVSALVAGAAYQVSDRLASAGTMPWDPQWNKTIVLRTKDALVTIGLTGPAFVGSRPIDEWVAEILFDSALPSGTLFSVRADRLPRRGLSTSLRDVEVALNQAEASGLLARGAPVGATIVGWRIQGHRVRVCAFALECHDSVYQFRRRTRSRHRFAGIGANPSGWVEGARLESLKRDVLLARSDAEREDLMIDVLREAAAVGHPVGPDAMCVRISGAHSRPRIRFAPASQQEATFSDEESGLTYTAPAIYTPVIVTPTCAQLAGVSTGPPFENLDGFEIDWDIPALPPPWIGDGRQLVWRVDGQSRPVAPQ